MFNILYLQEEPELIVEMISKVHKHCRLPLSVKIRVLDDIQATINYAKIIESAGASMLTVHGRLRSQKGVETGIANWDKIREVKDALKIPVVANGNIQVNINVFDVLLILQFRCPETRNAALPKRAQLES
jgi:tRNA-dihydrouridine synthase 1